ncbi:MAG: PilZ domain-containing protein [Oligoflexales bacterium]
MKSNKMIRVKFILSRDDEEAIWQFINESLRNKNSRIKSSHAANKSDGREDVRVALNHEVITIISIQATRKLPQQTIKGNLIDFSLGGAAIGIGPDEVVLPNSKGLVSLDFLRPSRKIKIEVLA